MIGVRSLFGHTVGRKLNKRQTFTSFSAFNFHESVINHWLSPLILMSTGLGFGSWNGAGTSKDLRSMVSVE